MRHRSACRRLGAALAASAAALFVLAAARTPAAAAPPTTPPTAPATTQKAAPPTTPATPAAAAQGTARTMQPLVAATRVHIVKRTSGPSCTGYSSQQVPPSTIRVLVHGATPAADHIEVVAFRDYVKHVLPAEWIPSWQPEALKAGAVAVTAYGWYWVTHYGGYLDSTGNCFDVTDDASFQVYGANTYPSTDAAVDATWGVVAQKSNAVLFASYACTLAASCTGGTKETCGQKANGNVLSQWGTQACALQKQTYDQILRTYYGATLALPPAGSDTTQLMMANDFTFGGQSTPATWNPTTGMWSIATLPGKQFQWGLPGDVPTVTNAGDGRALIGVWRPDGGWWYVKDVVAGGWTKTSWGLPGDIPTPAHFRGIDQPTVLAVFRPSNGRWYLLGGGSRTYGQRGDVPVPGHYGGSEADDYADQPAVWRPSTGMWYLLGVAHVQWGIEGDIPVPADYNGDGTTDVAVYRPSTQRWYIKGTPSFRWGLPGDIPVTGDFNGDGKADAVVYRPSTNTWYVHGQSYPVFGAAGDVPVGQAPYSS